MTAAQVRFETTEAGVLKAGQTSAQVRARAVEPGAGGKCGGRDGAGHGGGAGGGEPVHQS